MAKPEKSKISKTNKKPSREKVAVKKQEVKTNLELRVIGRGNEIYLERFEKGFDVQKWIDENENDIFGAFNDGEDLLIEAKDVIIMVEKPEKMILFQKPDSKDRFANGEIKRLSAFYKKKKYKIIVSEIETKSEGKFTFYNPKKETILALHAQAIDHLLTWKSQEKLDLKKITIHIREWIENSSQSYFSHLTIGGKEADEEEIESSPKSGFAGPWFVEKNRLRELRPAMLDNTNKNKIKKSTNKESKEGKGNESDLDEMSYFVRAIETAHKLKDALDRREAIGFILEAVASYQSHEINKASLISLAMDMAESNKNELDKMGELEQIIEILVKTNIIDKRVLFSRAIEIAEEFSDLYKIDVFILIAFSLVKIDEIDKAKLLLTRALKTTKSLGDFKAGKVAQIGSVYAMIGNKDQAKQLIEQALEFSAKIKNPDTQVNSFSDIIYALEKVTELNKTGFLVKIIKIAEGIKYPDQKSRAVSKILNHLSKMPDIDKGLIIKSAYEITKMLEGKGDSYSEIPKEFAEVGEYSIALDVVERIQSDYGKADALGSIAITISRNRDFKRALDIANKIHHPDKMAYVLSIIAGNLTEAGEFTQALGIAKGSDDPAIIEGCITTIIRSLGSAININKKEFFAQLLNLVTRINDADYKRNALSTILEGISIYQDTSCKPVLNQTLEIIEKFEDEYDKFTLIARLAECWANIGDLAKAILLISRKSKVLNEYEKDSAMGVIAGGFARTENFEKAFELVKSISSSSSQVNALEIISNCIPGSTASNKDELLKSALKVGESIQDEWNQSEVLSHITGGFARVGDFKLAFEMAEKIKKEKSKVKALQSIASALATKSTVANQ